MYGGVLVINGGAKALRAYAGSHEILVAKAAEKFIFSRILEQQCVQ